MEFVEMYKNLRAKFHSGNDIPVERTVITRKEFDILAQYLTDMDIRIGELLHQINFLEFCRIDSTKHDDDIYDYGNLDKGDKNEE